MEVELDYVLAMAPNDNQLPTHHVQSMADASNLPDTLEKYAKYI